MFTDFGPDWKPTAINNTLEFNDLREGHRQLRDIRTFWVYGTTDRPHNTLIRESYYRLDGSGEKLSTFCKPPYRLPFSHGSKGSSMAFVAQIKRVFDK